MTVKNLRFLIFGICGTDKKIFRSAIFQVIKLLIKIRHND